MSIKHSEDINYPPSVLLRKFSGKVRLDDIMASWEQLQEQGKFNDEIKGVLNDLNDCELDLDMQEFKLLIQYMNGNAHFKGLKLAVVTNSPQQIVFPTLAETINKELTIRPFSTIQSAIDWIVQ